jgi:hypothetical protein
VVFTAPSLVTSLNASDLLDCAKLLFLNTAQKHSMTSQGRVLRKTASAGKTAKWYPNFEKFLQIALQTLLLLPKCEKANTDMQ